MLGREREREREYHESLEKCMMVELGRERQEVDADHLHEEFVA